MYKVKFAAVAAGVLLFAVLSGCQGANIADGLGEKIGDSVKDAVADVKEQAADEIKNAVVSEIKEYFANGEASKSFGIDSAEQEEIINSVREYINNYEFDAAQLDKAKRSLEELLKNADGLSVDEIKKNIGEILGE